MSMAALKLDMKELRTLLQADEKDFLKIDATRHPLVIKWHNSAKTVAYYTKLFEALDEIAESEYYAVVRHLSRNDLAFLLCYTLNRRDAVHQWLIDRCWEVQTEPNGYLDLWAREHYKSTIITFALSIQDVITSHGINPDKKWQGREATIAIFSCTRPIAKAFLTQIKREFEANELLKAAFSDVFWDNPGKYAAKWSEDAGLVVKRKSNPKEATIEAWGIVEGQPTSKHFLVRVYDDLVTQDHVTSSYMIKKVISSWEVSCNLGTEGGYERYIGTRYHLNDPYAEMIRRTVFKLRTYQPTSDGSLTDNPVLKSKEELEDKLRKMGTYTYGCQMMQNPRVDQAAGFKLDWLLYHTITDWTNLNRYIVVDPANEKKDDSDYTAITVYGLGQDQNYYILERIRDRMNLGERWKALHALHKKYKPMRTGYERYGMQADLFYFAEQMDLTNYHFKIVELGGISSKYDRIRRLVPLYEDGRIYNPKTCIKQDYQGNTQDLTQIFIQDEFYSFPVSSHDDMLDCDARILDKIKQADGTLINFAEFPDDESASFDASFFSNKPEGIRG